MNKGEDDQQELPLPSQTAQEAATGAETNELLQAAIKTLIALGGRVDALSAKHDVSVEAIADQQRARTEDLARQVGTYSLDMRAVQADLQKLQSHIDGGDYRQAMRDDITQHVAHLKEEVGFLNSALDSHIDKFGAINHEGRKIIEAAIVTQQEANRSLEEAGDIKWGHRRFVFFIAFALAVASGIIGYQAALKFETDTGTWAHQMEKTWSPGSLCQDMGFRYETGLEDNTNYCIKAITKER